MADSTNKELRAAPADPYLEAGGPLAEISDGRQAGLFDLLGAERLNRQRRPLRGFFVPFGCDDDFFEPGVRRSTCRTRALSERVRGSKKTQDDCRCHGPG